jgi:acyl carrier protein
MAITLAEELRNKLLTRLNIQYIKPEEVDLDGPIFGIGLGLDSIDSLELIIMLEQEYGIKFSNPDEAKEVFASINSIAKYIESHKQNA